MIEKEELLTVIPHRGRMLLLSRVNMYNLEECSIEAEYRITEDCLFYDSAIAGVPAWVGFEFIAQAIAAFSGIRDRENGVPPKMGFILSVTSMQTGLFSFETGSTVEIRTREIERMNLLCTFEGEILLEGKKVLEGKITVMEVEHEQAEIMKKEYRSIE